MNILQRAQRFLADFFGSAGECELDQASRTEREGDDVPVTDGLGDMAAPDYRRTPVGVHVERQGNLAYHAARGIGGPTNVDDLA
jgi:hypothetical protein